MKFEAPLSSVTTDPKEAMRIISENLISTRPVKEPIYRPYRKSDIYYATESSAGWNRVELKKLYPEAKAGNVVYVSMIFDACDDYDGFVRFMGSAKMFLNGKEVFDSANEEKADFYSCPVSFKQGENNSVTFMVRCVDDNSFQFNYMASVRWYRMWAKWYLLNVVEKSPLPEYKSEESESILPSFIYQMDYWQFSSKCTVDGINGYVDGNLHFY